jgi:trans-2,3-dihydro-3-hydroxyanthranilate isomerase
MSIRRNLHFTVVDVFAQHRYEGNQLAVFHGEMPSGGEMQQIAREINFAETTFILDADGKENVFPVRIFTPEAEFPFAGHPTLGTAHVLREVFDRGTDAGGLCLQMKAGIIPVRWNPDMSDGIYTMCQNQPEFGARFPHQAAAVWTGLDLSDLDETLPVEWVSTGLPFVIVPLRSLDALRRAKMPTGVGREISRYHHAAGMLLFTHEGREKGHDLSVRVFIDEFGIAEDPATGSAHGCLAAWLLEHDPASSEEINMKSGQGHEVGRPSVLFLHAEKKSGRFTIQVGGHCITVAHGTWA